MPKFQFWLPKTPNLTRIQRRAIDATEPIFLSGVPGTGKTVVSIKRLQNAATIGKKAIIFTYGKLLKKTIEEKLNNDTSMPIDNIHNWMWNIQGDGIRQYFDIFTDDINVDSSIAKLKSLDIKYDEILVDEGQDLSLNTYKILKSITSSLSISADNAQQINNTEEATNEESIVGLFPNLKQFELDDIFRSTYAIYKFAIQFVPLNARANDAVLLERLKIKNPSDEKPFVYIEKDLNSVFDSIRDIIDENPTDNIGILFEQIVSIDTCARELSNDYEVSTYHSIQNTIPSELKNIIITTFKSAKGIEFDYVIIPYFIDARAISEEYYVGVTRAKNQVHILGINELPDIIKDFDTTTYELIDNRG